MGAGKQAWDEVRSRLQELLSVDNNEIRADPELFARYIHHLVDKLYEQYIFDC